MEIDLLEAQHENQSGNNTFIHKQSVMGKTECSIAWPCSLIFIKCWMKRCSRCPCHDRLITEATPGTPHQGLLVHPTHEMESWIMFIEAVRHQRLFKYACGKSNRKSNFHFMWPGTVWPLVPFGETLSVFSLCRVLMEIHPFRYLVTCVAGYCMCENAVNHIVSLVYEIHSKTMFSACAAITTDYTIIVWAIK